MQPSASGKSQSLHDLQPSASGKSQSLHDLQPSASGKSQSLHDLQPSASGKNMTEKNMTEKNTKDEEFHFSCIQMSVDINGYQKLGVRQVYGTDSECTYELYVNIYGNLDSGKFTDEVYGDFKKKYKFIENTDKIYLCLKVYVSKLPEIISKKNKNKFCILFNFQNLNSYDDIKKFKKKYIESSKYIQLWEYYPKGTAPPKMMGFLSDTLLSPNKCW